MGIYKRYSFIIKIGFQFLTFTYLFQGESLKLNQSALIISFVNLAVLFTDLGKIKDQLSLKKGIKDLNQAIYQTFLLTIVVLIPISILSNYPLFIAGIICSSGMLRNYQSKIGNHNSLFKIDVISSISALVIIGLDLILKLNILRYYHVVFLPMCVEIILYSKTCLRLIKSAKTKKLSVSIDNYISTILDTTVNNVDVILINQLFNPEIAKGFFQSKEIFKKSCQLSGLLVLRVIYDKLKQISSPIVVNSLLIVSILSACLEYFLNSTIFLSLLLLGLALTLHTMRLIKYTTIRYFNILQIVIFILLFIGFYLKLFSPVILFYVSMFCLIIISNNLKSNFIK